MTALTVVRGDITAERVDAVVNAANSTLLGGGGVDGAIHRAGGPTILEECRAIRAGAGDLPTGEAVVTTAGLMPARWVIHTVGPIYGDHEPRSAAALLAHCYANSLTMAVDVGATTIAFPNISTGVYGYPKTEAAEVAVGAVQRWINGHPEEPIAEVRFVVFDEENERLYRQLV